jgi:sugar lactone lactonase YvrE
VGPDGLIYVSDTFSSQFVVLDQDGGLVSVFGERGTMDTQVSFPEGVAVSEDNMFYVADRENNRVQAWQLSSEMPAPSSAEVKEFAESLQVF